MAGLKTRTAEVLFRAGVVEAICRRTSGRTVIFGYHRIRPDDPSFRPPFDDGVFGPTAREFRAQMIWLKQRRRVLSEAELIDHVAAGKRLPKGCAVVTFDDGYRDNYTLGLPVLQELGLPAIFFIPTALIEERRLGWWDLIAYFVKRSEEPSVAVAGRQYALGPAADGAIESLLEVMKLEPAERTENLVSELSEACGVDFPNRAIQDAELMSWAEIREAAAAGISISSHSHSHRILRTLDARSLVEELEISRGLLLERVGEAGRTIAYPGGLHVHFDERVQEQAAGAGYELGFSFQTGVDCGEVSEYDVRRLAPADDLARFAAIVAMPRVFSFAEASPFSATARLRRKGSRTRSPAAS